MKKVAVFCIWRDAEQHLPRTLSQLEELETVCGYSFSYFFYENDSTDKTAEILKTWIEAARSGSFFSEKINAPKFESEARIDRMRLFSSYRNKCKNLAGNEQFDYALLFDGDVIFNKENFICQIKNLESINDAVMTTANVRQNIPDFTFGISCDSYYDTWAFRDRYGNSGLYWSFCPFVRKHDRDLWLNLEPVPTMSSFGGFAVVKYGPFSVTDWHTDYACEHTNFCYDLSRFGVIYVIPQSKVFVDIDLSKYDLAEFQRLAKTQTIL